METSTSTHATTFRLNLQKGITNIGSHPANDIVIDDPRVQPFHLILDHRKKPYQIISLSPESNIRLNGVTIAGNDPIEVKDLNQVQFNGFSFHANLNSVGGETGEIEIASPRFQNEVLPALDVLPVIPEEQLPASVAPTNLSGLEKAAEPKHFSPALRDDIILVTLIEVNQQVDVETPAIYRLSVINAGPIVASFDVRVEGVPQEWVSISPRKLNLYESGRAETEIHISAPRDSASTAASYPIQFSISSPNYPDHVGQVDSSFVLNPYFEYNLGNLDPKQRSASYNKRTGAVAFPISNLGNSPEIYQVSAADDENGLQFEFPQPDQTRLARQAEVKVGPGETKAVPMVINPLRRHIFRLRGRQYHYNVHARQAEQESGGQLVSGSFTSQPLLGFFSLLLIVAVAAVGVFFLMRPRIVEFYAVKDIVEKGQAVTLRWKVSFFTRDLFIEGLPDPIQGSQSQVSTMPTSVASTYTLVASNWLSRTLRMPDLRSAPVTVLTIPAPPTITTFSVDKNEAFVGDTVKAKWSIGNADLAYLTVDGVTTILDPESFNGELPITLARDTLVVLEAKNNAGSLVRSEFLQAREPSILIEEFTLSKTTITLGDPVTIKWKVTGIGAESVRIAPFEEPLPLQGELTFYPKESMEFVMSVENRDLAEIRLLPVGVLPPGAPPEPPAISFFKAAPEEMVGEGTTEFSWSVSGTTDKIEITNSAGLVAGALPAQGFKSTLVKQTTNYIMTAYNKTVSSSAILEVKVKPDLMATQVRIHSTIPNSSIMRGDTMQVYFSVKPLVNGLPVDDVIAAKLPEVSGKVVVTDGFDTCEAELPKTSCVIQLNTSSANKKLTATYGGDANYARRTSPPYPETGVIMVMGTPTTFVSPPSYSINPVFPGELTKLTFFLGPLDPSKLDPVSGEVQVFEIVNSEEAATPLCRVNLGGVVGFPNQGTASCTFSFATKGPKILRVKYMGNAVYDGVITTAPEFATLEVKSGPTIPQITTNLTAPTVTGQPLTVAVLVNATGTAIGTPTGQVQIYDSANPAASCYATLTDGIGSCDIVFTLAGSRQVVTHYVGDTNFEPSDSGAVLHTVNQAATKAVFTSFPAPTQVGQTVTFGFLSEILAPGTGTLTGEAVVMDGITEVCRIAHVNNGVGTCSGMVLTSTAKAYRVVYDPDNTDPDFGTSESPVTSYLPVKSGTKFTVFTQSASEGINPSTVTYTVDVIADPVSSVDPIGTVQVIVENAPKSCNIVVPSADQTCSITFDTDGLWNVQAFFIENANYTASQSNILQYTVKKDSTVTVVSVNPPVVLIDQPVLFTVTVTPLNASSVVPTGTVIVTVNPGNQICTVTLNKDADGQPAPDYQGSCRLTFNKAASLAVTAQYLGDPLFVISQTGSSQPLSVTRAPTITEILSVSPASPLLGQAFTVNFSVTKAGSNVYNTGPTGSVRVSASASETCTGAVLSGGTGSCQLTLTGSGNRNLTAVYTETADVLRYQDGIDSTSAAFPVTVTNANTTIVAHVTRKNTTSPDINTAVINEPIRVNFTVTTQGSSIIPSQGLVTVTADAPGEQCTGLSSTIDGTGFCELKLTNTGSPRTLTVTYPNTTGFITSSTTYMVTVSKASVTLSLSASPVTIYVGQVLTYNVVVTPVTPSEGGPVGAVTLTAVDDANPQHSKTGTCSALTAGASNSTASCTISYPNPGVWTLTLDYTDTGGQYEPKTLNPAPTATVIKDTTATTITPSAGQFVVDSTVNFTVRVAAGNSTTVALTLPSSITFTLNKPGASSLTESSIACGTATIDFDSVAPFKAYLTASCSFTPDSKGDYKVDAIYPGDTNFLTSTSTQTTFTVVPLPTPMTLTPSASTYYVTQSYTFTASIVYGAGASPTGNVVFTSTGNTLPGGCSSVAWVNDGTTKTVTATCTAPLNTLGATTVTAAYAGDKKFAAALDQTMSFSVVQIPTVLAATANPLPVPIGDPFVYRDPGGSISFTFSVTANPAVSIVEGGAVTLQTSPADLFTTAPSCTIANGTCTISATIPAAAVSGEYVFSASYAGTSTFITSSMDLGTLMVRYSATFLDIWNYEYTYMVFHYDYLAVEVRTGIAHPFTANDTIRVEFTEGTDTIEPMTLTYRREVGTGTGAYHIFAVEVTDWINSGINNPQTTEFDSISISLISSPDNPTVRPFTPVTLTDRLIISTTIGYIP